MSEKYAQSPKLMFTSLLMPTSSSEWSPNILDLFLFSSAQKKNSRRLMSENCDQASPKCMRAIPCQFQRLHISEPIFFCFMYLYINVFLSIGTHSI